MRLALVICLSAAGLLASACASTPEGDVATYDTLREAREQCRSQGKDLVLRPDGNDRRVSGYECKGK
ncbi:MAG: hypothetical protein WCJ52_02050 [Phenylobacterium sp.]|uniref:hypothetical protein n=1 Tax=Phenylobacterium sp. TaxID=1871053 RepID=UPI00301A52CF